MHKRLRLGWWQIGQRPVGKIPDRRPFAFIGSSVTILKGESTSLQNNEHSYLREYLIVLIVC